MPKSGAGYVDRRLAVGAVVLVGILSAIATGGSGGSDVERALEELDEAVWHQSAAVADMDGDGIADIVTVSHILETNETFLNVFLQRAGGSFAPKIAISLGQGRTRRVEDVVVSDLNLDGLPDVIVAHIGLTGAGVTHGREVSVILKDGIGGGDFSPYRSYDVADNPYRLDVVDLDLDGLPDLAVAADGGTHLLLQDGGNPGSFLEVRRIDSGRARGLAVADFTDDGLPDVLTAGEFGVRLLANDITDAGSFTPSGTWTTPTWPSDVAIGDLNGDQRLDFAVALSQSDTFDRSGVAYRLQDSMVHGQFGAEQEVTFQSVRTLGSLQAQDLDGNGLADLAAAVLNGPDQTTMAVLIANQAGFGIPTLYSGPEDSGPWMAVIDQLGPDDQHDAVLAYSVRGVFVHYGEGAGTFAGARKIGE